MNINEKKQIDNQQAYAEDQMELERLEITIRTRNATFGESVADRDTAIMDCLESLFADLLKYDDALGGHPDGLPILDSKDNIVGTARIINPR